MIPDTMAEAKNAPLNLWQQALEDLKPFPGRAAMTWRVALMCALVAGIAMMYHIPLAAISCYLVIYLFKPDAFVNIVTGIGFLVILPGLIALLVWLTNLTSGSTAQVMLAIFISSSLLLYVGAATQLGEQANIGALIIAFVLTMIVKAPFGEAATFALREAWAMAALPMILMVVFNLFMGFSPLKLLRGKLLERLAAIAAALEHGQCAPLRELLYEGNAQYVKQALTVRLLSIVSKNSARQVSADVRASYALMLAICSLPDEVDSQQKAEIAKAVRATHAAIREGVTPPEIPLYSGQHPAERAAWDALGILAGNEEPAAPPALKASFIFPDALNNPNYPHFALKTTAAAIICFMVYTAMDWQGIHTAMVTCYVAALSTTGETVHKLALRITGALIGAALGVAAIFLVIPHIDSVAALMVLVFMGVLVGAWGSTGPERISYAGVQVALAFLLTILQGFGPSVSLDTAWDRIAGILLGNLVVYLIFSNIWPAPLTGEIRRQMAQTLHILASLARLSTRSYALHHVAAVEALVGQSKRSLDFLPFEPSHLRPSQQQRIYIQEALAQVEALNGDLWLSHDRDLLTTAAQLDNLAHDFEKPLNQTDHQADGAEESRSGYPFSIQIQAIKRAVH